MVRNNTKPKIFSCPKCEYKNNRKYNVQRHVILKHNTFSHQCEECNFKTKRKRNLMKHMLNHTRNEKQKNRYSCSICTVEFSSRELFEDHLQTKHKKQHKGCLIKKLV